MRITLTPKAYVLKLGTLHYKLRNSIVWFTLATLYVQELNTCTAHSVCSVVAQQR